MRPRYFGTWLIATLLCWTTLAAADEAPTERCKHHSPLRQVYWGDLHVHTRLSSDAYMSGSRVGPDGAYRFARGEKLLLSETVGETQLDRPLDFAAVTDHATELGATHLCTTPGSPVYNSKDCTNFRAPLVADKTDLKKYIKLLVAKTGGQLSSETVCGPEGKLCRKAGKTAWEQIQQAAAQFNDASDSCDFTTFVAYEYTATPDFTKVHRNVIFKNDRVLAEPISYADEPNEQVLWQRLKNECIDAGTGCDVLAIPHNPNLSNGNLFSLEYPPNTTRQAQADLAALRASIEPVLEIMQIKGDSECRNGLWNVLGGNDELCDWEKLRLPDTPDCKDGVSKGALMDEGCLSRLDYGRYALVEGLKEKRRIGVNPYKLGFIASTDTHAGTPGAVEEWRSDLSGSKPNPRSGRTGGGLVAVWAEENSRTAIFDALRRREVYGTSGPRMKVRLFAGQTLEAKLCDDPDLVRKVYKAGVPMGGSMSTTSLNNGAPRFLVMAQMDNGTPRHPGNLLQRAQIVKGWADAAGNIHQQVIDIVGGPSTATVDTDSCQPRGPGFRQLCGVWRDPDFDSRQDAVYYARVVENPSCRSAGWLCAETQGDDRPGWCNAASTPLVTQERAWTSPIWYSPPAQAGGE
ncbi:MAG: DUF3604 domain-containing protein [Pseudomonadales bacterium]